MPSDTNFAAACSLGREKHSISFFFQSLLFRLVVLFLFPIHWCRTDDILGSASVGLRNRRSGFLLSLAVQLLEEEENLDNVTQAEAAAAPLMLKFYSFDFPFFKKKF